MLSKKMLDELNAQINREYYSSYLYLSMSAYATSINMDGFAGWLRLQFNEELEHALKIYDYIHERQGRVQLTAIEKPALEWSSILDVFEQVVAHEQHITASIHNLYSIAQSEKDYASQTFLQWFVTEQVEEEGAAQRLLDRIRMVGDSKGSLLYLDKEAGKRAKE